MVGGGRRGGGRGCNHVKDSFDSFSVCVCVCVCVRVCVVYVCVCVCVYTCTVRLRLDFVCDGVEVVSVPLAKTSLSFLLRELATSFADCKLGHNKTNNLTTQTKRESTKKQK